MFFLKRFHGVNDSSIFLADERDLAIGSSTNDLEHGEGVNGEFSRRVLRLLDEFFIMARNLMGFLLALLNVYIGASELAGDGIGEGEGVLA